MILNTVELILNFFNHIQSDNKNFISKLNAEVKRKTLSFIKISDETGTLLSPEVQSISKSCDYNVYKLRSSWLPVFFSLTATLLAISNVLKPLQLMLSLIISFVWYDRTFYYLIELRKI